MDGAQLGAIVLGSFALFVLLLLILLLVDWAWRWYIDWRELRDRRVRDAQLKRYCITPYFGTKERDRP